MYTHTLNLVPPTGQTLEIRIGVERGAVHVQDVDSGFTGASPIAAHTIHETPYCGHMITLALYDLMDELGYDEIRHPDKALCRCGCTPGAFYETLHELAEELLMPTIYLSPPGIPADDELTPAPKPAVERGVLIREKKKAPARIPSTDELTPGQKAWITRRKNEAKKNQGGGS